MNGIILLINKKIILIFTLLLVCVCFLAGCGNTKELSNGGKAPKAVYSRISAEQAKTLMDSGGPYILLDVRTEGEFREERINGAMLIPVAEIEKRAEKELPDKDALILVYCRSGGRSASAANKLVSMGYTNVVDFGGITNWPYETTKE